MPALRFLVADPSRALQTFMQQLLQDYGFDAHGVRTADSAPQALTIAEDFKPDFLLSDWFENSELNGINLYQRLSALNTGCRFALLSKPVTPERQQEAAAAGAVFLLHKPCSAQELRSALGKAIALLAPQHQRLSDHFKITPGSDVKERIAQANRAVAHHLPQFKVGQAVVFKGRRDKVKYVILRRGEMVVQLHEQAGLIPATEVRLA